MKLDKLFREIEGMDFTLSFSVLSGFSSVLHGMESNEVVKSLIVEAQKKPANVQVIEQHLITLLNEQHDPQYEHPHEIALTAYLFTLKKVDPVAARSVGGEMVKSHNLGWARPLVDSDVSESAFDSDFETEDAARWDEQFANSPDTLDFLAREGREEYYAGLAEEFDPDSDPDAP